MFVLTFSSVYFSFFPSLHVVFPSGRFYIFLFYLQEGCWGLIDEFHKVSVECLSVMLFEIQAVLLAMRGGHSTCTIEDGREVS